MNITLVDYCERVRIYLGVRVLTPWMVEQCANYRRLGYQPFWVAWCVHLIIKPWKEML